MTKSQKSSNEQQVPENFCIRPWTELHIEEDGKVTPCCVMPSNQYPMGNNIKEYFEGSALKNLRNAFLKNQQHPYCEYCWKNERYNIRSHRVKHPTFNNKRTIEKIHIRLNNVCNFKCRMCGPNFSTTWKAENRKHDYFIDDSPDDLTVNAFDKDPKLLELIKVLIKNGSLKQINISGGEPLITDANVQLLQFLIDNKCTDVHLSYSTNLSNLHYKNHNLRDFWRHFKQVSLLASCDGWGAANEYGRSGFDTKNFLINLKKSFMFVERIVCVVNNYSVWSIPELLRIMDRLGKPVTFNPLYIPEHTNCKTLPQELQDQLRELYKHDDRLIELYDNFIAQPQPERMKQFIDFNTFLDGWRGTDFFKTFPQYKNYKHHTLTPTTVHQRVVHNK